MDIFFNDWSCMGAGTLSRRFAVVRDFDELTATLARSGICNLYFDKAPKAFTWCDFPLVGVCKPYSDAISADQRKFIVQILNRFSTDASLDSNLKASLEGFKDSVLMGNAHARSGLALSLTFDARFASPVISCSVAGKNVEINNLHRPAPLLQIIPQLCSRKACKEHKALVEPFWNTAPTKKYHELIEEDLALMKQGQKDKIQTLLMHSEFIANINGWVKDEAMTKKNRSSNKIRRIFRPEFFKRKDAYLSVDVEKFDIRFELHDSRGRHLGEISWDNGQVTGRPKTNHNLNV